MSPEKIVQLFPDAPKQQALAEELLKQIQEATSKGTVTLDGLITINLPLDQCEKKQYSHFLVKKVLHVLGYATKAKKPVGHFQIMTLEQFEATKSKKPRKHKHKKPQR